MEPVRGDILYLIACCGKKLPGGSGPPWPDARVNPDRNLFPELDGSRRNLITFYSELNEEDTPAVYTAPRGTGDRKQQKIQTAWAKNRAVSTAPTMPAMRRYQGTVYRKLGDSLTDSLMNGSVGNLLIVSALFGILHPGDWIPDYELMMKDKTRNGLPVYRRWRSTFDNGHLSELLRRYMPALEEIYCFMSQSTGYVPAIRPLSRDFRIFVVEVKEGSSGRSTRAGGRAFRRCIERGASSEEEIEGSVRAEGCVLVRT